MSNTVTTRAAGVPRASATRDWTDPGREWMLRAACREADSDLFFPVGTDGPGAVSVSEAKAVCLRCPVREQCLAYALTHGCLDGVWGGLTERERRALRRGSRVRG